MMTDSVNFPMQNSMTETLKIIRANWFDGYNAENDVDVLALLPIDEGTEEWLNHD